MEIQFNCPQCGLAMAASVEGREASVECPQCSAQFMVEAQMPVVQARAVPAQQVRPVAPGHGHSHAAPAQHSHGRRTAPPPHIQTAAAAARAAERAAAKQNKMLFMGLGGAVALLLGVMVFINWQGKQSVEAPPPPPAHVAAPAMPAVAPPDPEQLKRDEELRKREAALAASETADRERREEEARKSDAVRDEARARYQDEIEAMVSFLAENHFDGDAKAAAAYMKVHQDVLIGVSNLMEDGDPSNDLKSREDYETYVVGRLVYWFEKNEVLKEWLKNHQRDTRKFVLTLLQVEPKRGGSTPAPARSFDFTKYEGSGSGFFISADGWILTNEHVVSDAKQVDLRLRDGKIVQAKVVKTDEDKDLALLKAEMAPAGWLSVSKGASDLTPGRTVFTMGYPDPSLQGLEPKFTDGRISSASGIEDRTDAYQITVPVQPGNSGGPLVDFATGWVVGVIRAKLRQGENVTYAIKGSVVSTFFESVPEAKAAAAKNPAKPIAKGNEQEAIDRTTKASVLILRPRR